MYDRVDSCSHPRSDYCGRNLATCVSTSSFTTAQPLPLPEIEDCKVSRLQDRLSSVQHRYSQISHRLSADRIQHNDVEVTRAILALKKDQSRERPTRHYDKENLSPFQALRNDLNCAEKQYNRELAETKIQLRTANQKLNQLTNERDRQVHQLQRIISLLREQQHAQESSWRAKLQEQRLTSSEQLRHIEQTLHTTAGEMNKMSSQLLEKEQLIAELTARLQTQCEIQNREKESMEKDLQTALLECEQLQQEGRRTGQISNYVLKQNQSLRQEVDMIKQFNHNLHKEMEELRASEQSSRQDLLSMKEKYSEKNIDRLVQNKLAGVRRVFQDYLASSDPEPLEREYGQEFAGFLSETVLRAEQARAEFCKLDQQLQAQRRSGRGWISDAEFACQLLLSVHDIFGRFSKGSLPTTLALLKDEVESKFHCVAQIWERVRILRLSQGEQNLLVPDSDLRLAQQVRELKQRNSLLCEQNEQLKRSKTPLKRGKDVKMVGSEPRYRRAQPEQSQLWSLLVLQGMTIEERLDLDKQE